MQTRFNEERALHVRRVVEGLLVHTKSRFARQPFLLADWQWEDIFRPLFGWQAYDDELEQWVRLYRLAWLELARKNGKSEVLAAIALVLTGADDEEGAEVYGAAKDTDQAARVFHVAQRMIELAPDAYVRRVFKIYARNKRIVYVPTQSFYQVIPSDAAGNLGENPHGIVFDEVIAQPSREFWDALKTGFGVRSQPLMVSATTAGDDPESFAATEHEFSRKVADNPELDPRRLVVIRSVPTKIDGAETDPFDESLWPLANPAMKTKNNPGGFLSPQVLRDEATEAKNNPPALKAFCQFRLNQWQMSPATPWVPLEPWDATAGMVEWSKLKGLEVMGGLDLAATQDTVGLCWEALDPEVPEGYVSVWRFWVPESRLPDLDRRTGGQASTWAKTALGAPGGGTLLETIEGEVIDYRPIVERIKQDVGFFTVKQLGFDRWGAQLIVNELEELGKFDVVRIGQGYVDMSPGMKGLESAIRSGKYRHGGNPVARWQFGNVLALQDEAENIKPDRKRSRDKIDGMVAAIMAHGRWLAQPTKKRRRVAAV